MKLEGMCQHPFASTGFKDKLSSTGMCDKLVITRFANDVSDENAKEKLTNYPRLPHFQNKTTGDHRL